MLCVTGTKNRKNNVVKNMCTVLYIPVSQKSIYIAENFSIYFKVDCVEAIARVLWTSGEFY